MRSNFELQLKQLNLEMLKMAGEVEEIIGMAIKALIDNDPELAGDTIAYDYQVNESERRIESICLNLLLRQQPVAGDLRKISSALKMITDMERIGDQAADISELVLRLAGEEYTANLAHIRRMAEETRKMVTRAINAYVSADAATAREVIASDDIVDELFNREKAALIKLISEQRDAGEQAIDLFMAAKYFERIGDHAVNIAEWVLFSITGVHKNEKII
ncbi:MAG: phosphate signaling complex protein PhoU [Oscillospiraceae bacterium]